MFRPPPCETRQIRKRPDRRDIQRQKDDEQLGIEDEGIHIVTVGALPLGDCSSGLEESMRLSVGMLPTRDR
jgi:hypothetical protein